jgi:hypothetical protein
MKLELEKPELTSIIASLGKSSLYFEQVVNDKRTANWLLQIRSKLIKQGEKQGVFKGFFATAATEEISFTSYYVLIRIS